MAYRRVRGAILRLVRRRALSMALGFAMAAPAAWLEFSGRYSSWWMEGAALVADPVEIAAALSAGRVPVLAPYRWLRGADPLPHSWDVTSDSISAWVAGQVGAARLVLVKPSGAGGPTIVDPLFNSVLPRHIKATIVPADRIVELPKAIAAPAI